MDKITMNDVMAFSNEISSRDVTIAEQKHVIEEIRNTNTELTDENAELKHINAGLTDENVELRRLYAECKEKLKAKDKTIEQLGMMLEEAETQKMYCQTFIVLHKGKVKRFFATVQDLSTSSICYTMLVKSIPDDAPMEMLSDINEVSEVEHEKENVKVKNVFMSDSHCIVANGEVKENDFNT